MNPILVRIGVLLALATLVHIGGCIWAAVDAKYHESLATVVWKGEVAGGTTVIQGSHPMSASRRSTTMTADGLKLLIDGRSEPDLLATSLGNNFGEFALGERVHVTYVDGGALLWHVFGIKSVRKLTPEEQQHQAKTAH
jgi:hypothetical protein